MKKATLLRLGACLPVMLWVALVMPSAASAAVHPVRYAAPGASGDCSAATPCSLTTAVSGANDNDQVILESGLGPFVPGVEVDIAKAIDIGGVPGAPVPRIDASGVNGVRVISNNVHLHDLRIDSASGQAALSTDSFYSGMTAERLFVSTESSGSSHGACEISEGMLRDSVCWGSGGSGVTVSEGGSATKTISLRNVTAIGTGATIHSEGIKVNTSGPADMTIDAVNVIARGQEFDVQALSVSGSRSTLDLRNSNFATHDATVGAAGNFITSASSNGNQITVPLFASAATGDFHELAGSPTIDAGISDPLMGSFDLDYKARVAPACVGGAAGTPDIGAYEFATVSPPIPACGKFTLGALKRNKKKGTAKLTVTVPGSGAVVLSGKGLKKSSVTASSSGNDTLTLKAKGKAKHKLAAKGKIKLKTTISFTPTGGTANTQTAKLKLKEKKR
jgi:hypothetical protein